VNRLPAGGVSAAISIRRETRGSETVTVRRETQGAGTITMGGETQRSGTESVAARETGETAIAIPSGKTVRSETRAEGKAAE
jgi:hypothetical protein